MQPHILVPEYSWHEHVVCGVAEQSTSPCVCVSCDAKVLIVHKYTQELNTQLQLTAYLSRHVRILCLFVVVTGKECGTVWRWVVLVVVPYQPVLVPWPNQLLFYCTTVEPRK